MANQATGMKMRYREYLKSDQWRSLRKQARIRAGNRCEMCAGQPDHVHHVRYPQQFKDDHINNLIVLCETCHAKSHGIRGSFFMTNEITIFNFNEKKIRVIHRNGKQLFRLYDVINSITPIETISLDSSRVPESHLLTKQSLQMITNRLDEDEKEIIELPNNAIPGTTVQEVWITEEGIYGVVWYFETPKAQQFKRWVKHDVLPAIRKTGEYRQNTSGNPLLDQAKVIVQMIEEHESLKKQTDLLENRIIEMTGDMHYQTTRIYLQKHGLNPQTIYPDTQLTNSTKLGGWCNKKAKERRLKTPPKIQEGSYLVNQWPEELLAEGAKALGLLH